MNVDISEATSEKYETGTFSQIQIKTSVYLSLKKVFFSYLQWLKVSSTEAPLGTTVDRNKLFNNGLIYRGAKSKHQSFVHVWSCWNTRSLTSSFCGLIKDDVN